ncbi:hypothetical protein BV25DRAFT_1778057, partial [Artomyces pyxidatus]
VFVIARILPHGDAPMSPRYRCIAAFHHQFCYGSLPVRATHRFITLVKQKENTEIIAAELITILGLYGRWDEEPKIPRVPAPFVTFLLATCWTTTSMSRKMEYQTRAALMELSASADDNDGISVIDITNPTSPAYCFNHISELPLSAREYLSGYYNLPKEGEELTPSEDGKTMDHLTKNAAASISLLRDVLMVTIEMLAEAWPSEY